MEPPEPHIMFYTAKYRFYIRSPFRPQFSSQFTGQVFSRLPAVFHEMKTVSAPRNNGENQVS